MMRRVIFWCQLLLPLILLLSLVGWWLEHTLAHPVGQVSIYGEVRYVSLDNLEQLALPYLSRPFWRVDLRGLQAALEAEPWLKKVTLTRRWPDQLLIHLEERDIWARWGEKGLLDHQGEGFIPTHLPDQALLPERSLKVAAHHLPQALLLWQALEPLLAERQLTLTKVELAPRGAWQFEINSAIRVMLGRDNIEQRMNRFIWAWDHRLMQEAERIHSVDLRYPNGMSVHWQ